MESQLFLRPRHRKTMVPPVIHTSSQETSVIQTTPMMREQSLSFVEIFLNAAIATVLYSRELFKHDSSVFAERCVADLLDNVHGPVTYKDFLDVKTQAGQTKSQVFKILLKGKSPKADRILTLLEGGIFNALQSSYLETIQLSIFADSSRPSEVLECYTFTITYSYPRHSGRNVSGIKVSTDSQTVFFVSDAQKSFNAAIKGLLKFIRGLPRLPGRRNVGLNLFYTDDCPPTYEPEGFTSCTDYDLHFPSGPRMTSRSKRTPSLVVGAHFVGVVVSHVDSLEEVDKLQVIPEQLDYPNKRSRLDEYKATSAEITSHQTNLSSQSLPMPFPTTVPSGIMASPAAPSTQTRHDLQTKEALQRMQRSSSKPQDLIPTQSLVNPEDDLEAEDSNAPDQSYFNAILRTTQTADRRERMIVSAKMAELFVHVRAVQEGCSPGNRIFDDDALKKYEIKRRAPPNVIKCECLDNSDMGTMLFCEICGTWQHQSCYGWDGVEEKLCPVDHVCYGCLLLPGEKDLNDWMPILVACRNALKYLYKNGFPDDGQYGGMIEAMHFKGPRQHLLNSNVMQILVKQQLVETAEFGCRIIEVNRQKGMVEYVDPLASIFHLYQIRPKKKVPLSSMTKDAVRSLEQTYNGFALDAIHTQDSFGSDVVRYGYYPRLAAIQSRKRSSAVAGVVAQGGQHQGAGGEVGLEKLPGRTMRKMSRSKLVCFDESSSDGQTQSEDTVLESDEDGDLYN